MGRDRGRDRRRGSVTAPPPRLLLLSLPAALLCASRGVCVLGRVRLAMDGRAPVSLCARDGFGLRTRSHFFTPRGESRARKPTGRVPVAPPL